MLNIGRLRPGGAEYYVGEVATSAEDYYLGHGEAPGRWIGSLAPRLGLDPEAPVDPDHFRRLLEGRHPITGEQLVAGRRAERVVPHVSEGPDDWLTVAEAAHQLRCSDGYLRRLLRAGVLDGEKAVSGPTGRTGWRVRRSVVNEHAADHHAPKARPGFDVTLRPPKSVSILWALGSDEQRAAIRAAHREAVDEVVRYLQAYAILARRKGDHVLTDGLVAAAFDHRTSRSGDPLLHTHVVVANLTHTALGTWRALDGRPLFDHALSGGHLYQAHLRHLLSTRLGVRWTPVQNGWAEIIGVPPEVITEFSRRRDEIEELLAESGYTSARARQAATLASRSAKDRSITPETLADQWRSRAAAIGFDAGSVERCVGHEPPEPLTDAEVEALLDRLGGPHGVTERASTFMRRDAVKWLASAAGNRMTAAEIDRATSRFLGSARAVPLLPDGRARRRQGAIGRDGQLVRTAGLALFSTPEILAIERGLLEVAEQGAGYRPPTAMEAAIEDALTDRPELSAEQRTMVAAVCRSNAVVQPIVGRPGSGKTYAADACAAAFRDSDVIVLGCATSATAASELERATGVRSSTIAGLLRDADDPHGHGLPPRVVLLVDEASMVGTRDLARLVDHVVRARGALKLIGDPDQHTAVDTGGVFPYLATHTPEVVALVENNRQVDADERLAIDDYRRGRIAEALARYDDAGKVVRCATAGECHGAMVADWYAARLHGSTDPMLAGPNSTRRELNRRARALLAAEGALTGPALVVAGREFLAGDEVMARRNDRSLRAPGQRSFVKNGSVGKVVEVDVERGELVVAFEREGTIRLPAAYLDAGHLEHAYARTTYLAQGGTYQLGRFHPTDVSRFEEGYVALTRARHQTRIYVVEGELHLADEAAHHATEPDRPSLDTVATAMATRGAKSTAHEVDPRAGVVAELHGRQTATELRARLGRDGSRDVNGAVLDPEERELLGRALAAARLQERISATVDRIDVMERLLGPRPDDGSASEYQWDVAAQLAREHWADSGWRPSSDATELEELLGPRPSDFDERDRYEQIATVHEYVRELDHGPEISL